MRAVCLAGPSDSGKTTLVEQLVGTLPGRVGTIKSIHHDIEIDTPGTDTFRHRAAGAETVVGITPGLTFSVTPGGKGRTDSERTALEETLERLEARGLETVLVEGYAAAPLPTIVVGDDLGDRRGPVIARGEEDLESIVATILAQEDWRRWFE